MVRVMIGDRKIGEGEPAYIIAEIGNNHGGRPEVALRMIEAAATAGADAVKFQTFRGRDIVSPRVRSSEYPDWGVADQFEFWADFLDTLVLPRECYPELLACARQHGVHFISTPTSVEAAGFLAEVGADAIKIASMDLLHHPLLECVAGLGLPVILSTGMSTLQEIDAAVDILRSTPLALLYCVSEYPLNPADAQLRRIANLRARYDLPIGFSDHSLGHLLDVAAICLGASLIEKHLTLDRQSPARAEHHFSIEPEELSSLVRAVREVEAGLGSADADAVPSADRARATAYRRSLQLTRPMRAGDVIGVQDLVALRPGTGLEPRHLHEIVGRRLAVDVEEYVPLGWSDLA